jgi:hypothetical protein
LTDKEEKEKNQKHFFDVERFLKIRAETPRKRGRLSKTLGRVTGILDSFQGAFAAMFVPLIFLGTLFVVIFTLRFGALVFLGTMAAIIGGLTLYVDRKVGKSLQFAESNFLKKTLAQIVGVGLAVGIVVLVVFLSRSPLLHFP